jgi:hypothetical protein
LWFGDRPVASVTTTCVDVDHRVGSLAHDTSRQRMTKLRCQLRRNDDRGLAGPPFEWSVTTLNLLIHAVKFSSWRAAAAADAVTATQIHFTLQVGSTTVRAGTNGDSVVVAPLANANELLHHTAVVERFPAIAGVACVELPYREASGEAALLAGRDVVDDFVEDPRLPHHWISGLSFTVAINDADAERLDALKLDLPVDYTFKRVLATDLDGVCPTAASTWDAMTSTLASERWLVRNAQLDGVVRQLSDQSVAISSGQPIGVKLHVLREAHLNALRGMGQTMGARAHQAFEVWPSASSPSSGNAPVAYVTVQRGGALSVWYAPSAPPTPDSLRVFLRSLRYSNTDNNPHLLSKGVLVTLRDADGSQSYIPIDVRIEAVDDPTEIQVRYSKPVVYRPLTTETEPWPKALAKMVSRLRDRFRELHPIAKWFPEASFSLQPAARGDPGSPNASFVVPVTAKPASPYADDGNAFEPDGPCQADDAAARRATAVHAAACEHRRPRH